MNSVRIDGIKYGNVVYKRQDNLSSEPRIRKIREAVKTARFLVRKFNGTTFKAHDDDWTAAEVATFNMDRA